MFSCQWCWRGTRDGLCRDCLSHFPWLVHHHYRWSDVEVHALCQYRGWARYLLQAYKLRAKRGYAQTFAALWTYYWRALPRAYDGVIAVPSRHDAIRKRGFDAIALWAEKMAYACGWPYYAALARDPSDRIPQGHLLREQRLYNVHLSLQQDILPGHYLLVDDVMTTGTTLRAAQTCLLEQAGVTMDFAVFAVSAWGSAGLQAVREDRCQSDVLSP